MSLFHKPEKISMQEIISMCEKLSLNLQKHYLTNGNAENEFQLRGRIFDESGIRSFKGMNYTDSMQIMKRSLKYCIHEQLGPISNIYHTKSGYSSYYSRSYDPLRISNEMDQVLLTVLNRFDAESQTQYIVKVIMPESVWKKRYSHYNAMLTVEGLVSISYNHSPSYNLEFAPPNCFMIFNISVFVQ